MMMWYTLKKWDVAKLVRRRFLAPKIVGSNPTVPAIFGLFRNWSPIWAAFSLVARSASQMFSWGELELGRGESRACFLDKKRFNPSISAKACFNATGSAISANF
jgi:hypothetical protein